MSTRSTILDVLNWAVTGEGDPPEGRLDDWNEFFGPTREVRETLQQLTMMEAARMRLHPSIVNRDATVGSGGLILAAAIGARNQPHDICGLLLNLLNERPSNKASRRRALRFFVERMPVWSDSRNDHWWRRPWQWSGRLIDRWKSAWLDKLRQHELKELPWSRLDNHGRVEWLARHAVLRHALPKLPEHLADSSRLASPLTAILDCPEPETEPRVLQFAERLLKLPDVRLAIQLRFADPKAERRVRDWRTRFLQHFVQLDDDGRVFALDVYVTGVTYYQEEMFAAENKILERIQVEQEWTQEEAIEARSVVDRWAPLYQLEQQDPSALRQRRHLGYDYRKYIDLYKQVNNSNG